MQISSRFTLAAILNHKSPLTGLLFFCRKTDVTIDITTML